MILNPFFTTWRYFKKRSLEGRGKKGIESTPFCVKSLKGGRRKKEGKGQ